MLVLFSSVSFSDQSPDAFMGDWKGTRKQEGKEVSIVAQVIAWGKGKYQANLLDEFDKRGKLIIKLEGNLKSGKVIFDRKMEGKSKPGKKHPLSALLWSCEISNNKFTGKFTGKKNGTFEMKKAVRLSTTLNAKPPKGAIVLFDGSNLDEWDIIKKKKRTKRKKNKIEVIEPLPGKWKLIKGGAMEIVPKTGSLIVLDLLLGQRIVGHVGGSVDVDSDLFDLLLDRPVERIEELEVRWLLVSGHDRLCQLRCSLATVSPVC